MNRDLLAAGRVANLPTVWSNIVVSAALTLYARAESAIPFEVLTRIALSLLLGSLLYLAGCFYNDYHDRHWDARFKPERGIPAGRLSPSILLKLALLCLGAALIIASCQGLFSLITALAVTGSIWVYTLVHKKTVFGIIPMGLCRAGLYLLGAYATLDTPLASPSQIEVVFPSFLLIPAIGLLLYIAGLTLIARSEATLLPPWCKYLGTFFLLSPLLTHFTSAATSPYLGLIGILIPLYVYKSFLLQKGKISQFVSTALAGICLIDGLALLSCPSFPPFYTIPFLLFTYGSAKLLQRIAPAT